MGTSYSDVFQFFLFVFHTKSANTNNWRELSDISFQSRFSRDSNGFLKFSKNVRIVKKNRFEILTLSLISSERAGLTNNYFNSLKGYTA